MMGRGGHSNAVVTEDADRAASVQRALPSPGWNPPSQGRGERSRHKVIADEVEFLGARQSASGETATTEADGEGTSF